MREGPYCTQFVRNDWRAKCDTPGFCKLFWKPQTFSKTIASQYKPYPTSFVTLFLLSVVLEDEKKKSGLKDYIWRCKGTKVYVGCSLSQKFCNVWSVGEKGLKCKMEYLIFLISLHTNLSALPFALFSSILIFFFLIFVFHLFSSLLTSGSLTLDLWGRLPSPAMEAASGDQPHHCFRAGSVRKSSTRSSGTTNQTKECI